MDLGDKILATNLAKDSMYNLQVTTKSFLNIETT